MIKTQMLFKFVTSLVPPSSSHYCLLRLLLLEGTSNLKAA